MKKAGCELLVQVKENQPTLLKDCQRAAATEIPVDTFTASSEQGHGRKEERSCRVFNCIQTTDPEWTPLIARIIEVHRVCQRYDSKEKRKVWSDETAFYLCSRGRTAKDFNFLIRGHWGIENRNHRVRDGSLREDASRIRTNPGIMARCRSFTLNILRANRKTNIAHSLYENALSFKILHRLRFLWN